MRSFIFPILFSLSLGCTFAQEMLVTFAANLDNAGGANRLDISGSDIYSVLFDPAAQKVSSLKRLTNTANQGEYFPSLSPDLKWVAADRLNGNVHEIILIHLETGTITSVYRNGRFPEWVNHSELLVTYTAQSTQDIYKLSLDLSAAVPKVNKTEQITDRTRCPGTSIGADAFPYSNGSKLIFNTLRSSGETGAAVASINLDGSGFKLLTDWNGAGHTAPSNDGKFIFCSHSQSGKPSLITINADGSTSFKNLDAPATTSAYMQQFDTRFKDFNFGNYSYQTWGANERAVFQSAQGVKEAENKAISRIIYTQYDENWQNPQLINFSGLVEVLAGKSGKDFTTTSGRITNTTTTPEISSTPIYLNFVTHNEPTDKLDYEKNQADFNTSTSLVKEFANAVINKNARWNLQTAPKYLMGVIKWEDAVNNKNDVLESLHNSAQIDVDPRQKTGLGYSQNIADVAYLLGTIGVSDTKTVGGFIGSPAQNADWEKFNNPVKGTAYPNQSWQAEILWGAASFGHQNDDLQNYGIWKPKDKANFLTHESNNKLWNIGNGCSNVLFANTNPDSIFQNIKNVIRAIETGKMPADKFYSMTIMTNQRDFSTAYIQKINWLIDSLNTYSKQGKIVWATLREKLTYFSEWSKQNNQGFSQFSCTATPIITSFKSISSEGFSVQVFPNPATDHLVLRRDAEVGKLVARLFDGTGRTVIQATSLSGEFTELDVDALVGGVYFLEIRAEGGLARKVKKIVIVR